MLSSSLLFFLPSSAFILDSFLAIAPQHCIRNFGRSPGGNSHHDTLSSLGLGVRSFLSLVSQSWNLFVAIKESQLYEDFIKSLRKYVLIRFLQISQEYASQSGLLSKCLRLQETPCASQTMYLD